MARNFDQLGDAVPASPVVLSVPHAGRDYPPALTDLLRVPVAALLPLEDRHVDAVARAARTTQTLLVQRTPRAWIDLNRGEDDRDPMIDDGAAPVALPLRSVKVRSGLGLVPRRVAGAGEVWRRRLSAPEVMTRIVDDHRPYHQAVSAALAAAWRRFGIAVLLDIHSMPPLGAPDDAPRVVLGDRFGRSAANRLVRAAAGVIRETGLKPAFNAPYAGGHMLDRHARPRLGVHGIQLELDRGLYLDAALDGIGPGLAATATLVGRIIVALEDAALGLALPHAAE
ncbi:N-formylglutamate amidohydrolase [Sphingomonas sp. Leaf17]|uniref:N-formylglutamate amidohydrolase n=1 Tax=Sphingomonas sp. Leaf17 TaxID=1735683 RepID=UPI0006F351E3|nr:N-formylglutamate amidohydrolase [Sphingomonas sp. Leaf17]KQM67642.1 N-formylglutamate amidohydrolase [Sphingomonas sp. Leaf17]